MILRNRQVLVRTIVLMLTLAATDGRGQERIYGGTTDGPVNQGSRVIEPDEDESLQGNREVQAQQSVPVTTTMPVRNPTGAGVEMIIGGQGSGGVAKKGTLPVVD